MYSAASKAFDHRKHALQNIVQLYVSGFYSEPKSPSTSKSAELKRRKEREKKLNKMKEKM